MDRRSLIVGIGSACAVPVSGCLETGDGDGTDGEGVAESFELFAYNYRETPVTLTIEAVADGESVFDGIVELTAPETVSTTEQFGTVPAGTRELAIDATIADEGTTASETFDLPLSDPISGVEIRAESDGRLRIAAMEYEEPAEP